METTPEAPSDPVVSPEEALDQALWSAVYDAVVAAEQLCPQDDDVAVVLLVLSTAQKAVEVRSKARR